jgi:catechol 2,3-dioxygenase
MSVSFLKHVAVGIPEADKERATAFYCDFGLEYRSSEGLISFRCKGRRYDSLSLIAGAPRKKLHHVSMGATEDGLAVIRDNAVAKGLDMLDAPAGFSADGIWLRNAHNLLFNIEACTAEDEVAPEAPFLVNSPGHYNRINAAALPPKSEIADVVPRKLGHALLFTPDIDESIYFLVEVLGMRLSDRSQDVVAFLHCPGGSDHHVIALAKSSGIGFHHLSFMVGTPDEVGLGGRRMIEKGHEQGWGFGRHAIGSNFFHYCRDPWGSYVEYYADIDYIRDSDDWEPRDWPLEDSLHTWGPNPPEDMVHNYEMD